LTSNVPDVNPRRASIWAALACASFNCASVSAARRRINSAPSVTGVPRSTGAETTRPAVSAATSACSSAINVPVARMNRAIGRSTAAAAATEMRGGAAACSLVLALPALQADATAAARKMPMKRPFMNDSSRL